MNTRKNRDVLIPCSVQLERHIGILLRLIHHVEFEIIDFYSMDFYSSDRFHIKLMNDQMASANNNQNKTCSIMFNFHWNSRWVFNLQIFEIANLFNCFDKEKHEINKGTHDFVDDFTNFSMKIFGAWRRHTIWNLVKFWSDKQFCWERERTIMIDQKGFWKMAQGNKWFWALVHSFPIQRCYAISKACTFLLFNW